MRELTRSRRRPAPQWPPSAVPYFRRGERREEGDARGRGGGASTSKRSSTTTSGHPDVRSVILASSFSCERRYCPDKGSSSTGREESQPRTGAPSGLSSSPLCLLLSLSPSVSLTSETIHKVQAELLHNPLLTKELCHHCLFQLGSGCTNAIRLPSFREEGSKVDETRSVGRMRYCLRA